MAAVWCRDFHEIALSGSLGLRRVSLMADCARVVVQASFHTVCKNFEPKTGH
jgi:hypothetical protein